MRSATMVLGLLTGLGAGYVAYQNVGTRGAVGQAPPQQQIDVIAVRSQLLSIANAEQQYLVTHSTFATLDELQNERLLTGPVDQRGYVFSIAVDGGRSFTVTAAPADANKPGWPTLAVDETMQVAVR